jgi:hypothetical protein
MKHIILFAFLLCFAELHAQKLDYKIYRDSITKLSCKPQDSLTVARVNQELLSIDTMLFDQNMHIYYMDLAWSYYRLYLKNKDTSHLIQSTETYLKADFHDPNNSTIYWNLMFQYFLLLNCQKGYYYLERYLAVTDEEFIQREQIKLITKRCEE